MFKQTHPVVLSPETRRAVIMAALKDFFGPEVASRFVVEKLSHGTDSDFSSARVVYRSHRGGVVREWRAQVSAGHRHAGDNTCGGAGSVDIFVYRQSMSQGYWDGNWTYDIPSGGMLAPDEDIEEARESAKEWLRENPGR